MRCGQACGFFLASNENEEVVVFQVGIPSGVEKWKFDLPALFCKVVCDVWCNKEETRLLVRRVCLGLSEHLGSNTDLGFYRKFVLPPVCFYFDYGVELVAVQGDRWFPADDLRDESGRALKPLEGSLDQFCVLGFMSHCDLANGLFMFPCCT